MVAQVAFQPQRGVRFDPRAQNLIEKIFSFLKIIFTLADINNKN